MIGTPEKRQKLLRSVSDFLSVDAAKVFSWLWILHDINPLYTSVQIRDDVESQLQLEGIPERLLETALVASEQDDIMLESITRSNIAREQTGISSVHVGPACCLLFYSP